MRCCCCSALFARYKRFLGRLPKKFAFLLQILLLALVTANVFGFVISLRRYMRSNAHPLSVTELRHLDSPPPFSVVFWKSLISNMTMTCEIAYENNTPCPRAPFAFMQDGYSLTVWAGTATGIPFVPGDTEFFMTLRAHNTLPNECVGLQMLGVPLEAITPENVNSLITDASPLSRVRFCPTDITFYQSVYLYFTALQDVHDRVTFSISAHAEAGMIEPFAHHPEVFLDIDTEGGVVIPWETQQYDFTFLDFLASIFANFTMSVTIVTLLFPWGTVGRNLREERSFQLQCDWDKCKPEEEDQQEEEEDDDEEDMESQLSSRAKEQQLQERMLPRGTLSSLPLADALALQSLVENAVQRGIAEWRRGAPAPVPSQL